MNERTLTKRASVRHASILAAGALFALATAASAQQLFTVEEPSGPARVQSAAIAGDGGGIGPAPISIRLDTSLLAASPEKLMLPDMGHGQTWIQKAHFEEREGGVTWAGGAEGGFIESSVLTVHDGYTVGRLMDDHGNWWALNASPSGVGRAVQETNSEGMINTCAAEIAPDHDLTFSNAGASHSPPDQPERVADSARIAQPARSAKTIDTLFIVTNTARGFYLSRGLSADAQIQAMLDYTNLVFRNSRVDAVVRAVGTIDSRTVPGYPIGTMNVDANNYHALRREVNADIVALVDDGEFGNYWTVCGAANIPIINSGPRKMSKFPFLWTDLNCDKLFPGRSTVVFTHELGHLLGVHHAHELPHGRYAPGDRKNSSWSRDGYGFYSNPGTPFDDPLKKIDPHDGIKTNVGNAGNAGAHSPGAIVTQMGYLPNNNPGWILVPYFSMRGQSLKVGDLGLDGPEGTTWPLGRADYANAARLLRATTRYTARASEHQYMFSRAPLNFSLRYPARDPGDGTIRLSIRWDDESLDETGFIMVGEEYELLPVKNSPTAGHLRLQPNGTKLPETRFPAMDGTGLRTAEVEIPYTPHALMIWMQAENLDGLTVAEGFLVGKTARPDTPGVNVDMSKADDYPHKVRFTVKAGPRFKSNGVRFVAEFRPASSRDWESAQDQVTQKKTRKLYLESHYIYDLKMPPKRAGKYRVTAYAVNYAGESDPFKWTHTVAP